jgi:antitoxin (DNA-binding transcriptional repressor) of toxin-antitoxin stability system
MGKGFSGLDRNGTARMTTRVTIDEAQKNLRRLVEQLSVGDELVITENEVPIATLVGKATKPDAPRIPGLGKGIITVISDDDDHLQDFVQYMQ